MKIVFSRKGFDSKSGGGPSPILDGTLFSLPIPTDKYPSASTYGALGLGDAVTKVSKTLTAESLCHEDPMFWDNKCAFGQTGTAQSHLDNNDVGVGDVFLFFGLFTVRGSKYRHHRIFGYLNVEKVLLIGSQPKGDEVAGTIRQHPHTIEKWETDERWDKNNTIYTGSGRKTIKPLEILRLTKHGCKTSYWAVPQWLRETKLTYHQGATRWLEDGLLRAVGRGQEFITDIEDRPEPKLWLNKVIAAIDGNEG
jgi:hypothetical protein